MLTEIDRGLIKTCKIHKKNCTLNKCILLLKQLMEWQSQLMNPQILSNSSTCELAEEFIHVIEFPTLPSEEQTRLDEILNMTIRASCITDINPLFQEIMTKLNINGLLNEVRLCITFFVLVFTVLI